MSLPVTAASFDVILPPNSWLFRRTWLVGCLESATGARMAGIANITGGLIFLASLIWVDTASAQATYSASVSRHRDLPAITEAEVRTILAKASKTLKKEVSHNDEEDVGCDVEFTVRGPVRTFMLAGGAVVDQQNIEAAHDIDSNVAGDFHIKLVKEIHFCRPDVPHGPHDRFDGCSYRVPDARSIIAVHPKLHKDGNGSPLPNYPDHLLWAHEFGHLTGLPHRHDNGIALMTACSVAVFKIPDSCVRVNRAECNSMLAGPVKPPSAPFGQCLLPPSVTKCQ
jgi:hypothetical protein